MYRIERLLLKPGRSEDSLALFRAIADLEIVRNLSSAPWGRTAWLLLKPLLLAISTRTSHDTSSS